MGKHFLFFKYKGKLNIIPMRNDHVAYRVADRNKTAQFFINCFGYRIDSKIPEGFDIQFEDETWAKCLVLLPPESPSDVDFSWIKTFPVSDGDKINKGVTYHMAPEIFISDGSDGSIDKEWVDKRGGVGGIHHMAFQVTSVEGTMRDLLDKGYVEFTTDKPLTCPGLTQIFTKPSELTGIIYEFIERTENGFCKDNVKNLMTSTKNL